MSSNREMSERAKDERRSPAEHCSIRVGNMTTQLHRAIVEGVECVLVPAFEHDFDYPCRGLKCPRYGDNNCSIEMSGYNQEDVKQQRGCYRPHAPYSGFWSPVTHYLTLRLTGQLEAPQPSDL